MRKYLYNGKLLLFALFVMVSCATDDKKEEQANLTSTDNVPKTEDGKPQALLTPGELDTLYISRAAFDTINPGRKFVFSFTFVAADSLSLHGWLEKPGAKEFDSLPNIPLLNGNASPYKYALGTYFGNIILKSSDYTKLKTALNNASVRFVVFAPYKVGNNIGYKLYTTKGEAGMSPEAAVMDPVDVDLNPSPPKNY